MPWNRRQLADLVGATANNVRLYHRLELLDEPPRRLDGQRHYEVRHLVRLFAVRRLAHLGVLLHDIAEMGSETPPSTMLRLLETELTKSIAHLGTVRGDLATAIALDAPYDVPAEFGDIAGRLTAANRALNLICSRLIPASALDVIREQFTTERTEPQVEFDSPPSLVDDVTLGHLAEAVPPHPVLVYIEGVFAGADANTRLGDDRTRDILLDAVVGVHNAAQSEVLRRLHPLLDSWLDWSELELSSGEKTRSPDDLDLGAVVELENASTVVDCANAAETAPKRAVFDAAPFIDPGIAVENSRNGCENWPVDPTLNPLLADEVDGLADTLVVSVTGDGIPPHAGGIALAEALGGSLLTVEGEQHGASLAGNACVDAIVSAYLVDLESPAPDARCNLALRPTP